MSSDKLYVANAIAVWKGAYEKADKLFSSLTEEDLGRRVAPERNRLAYLWGHLTAMHDRMIVLLGLGDRLTPQFDAVFLTSPDGAAGLPPIEEIRNAWKQVSDQLNTGISTLSASEWLEKHTAVSEEEFAKDPLRNKLSILLTRTSHVSYHIGQATLVRR